MVVRSESASANASRCARVIDDAHARVRGSDFDIDGDASDAILNGADNAVRDARAEARSDLEIERISGGDRIRRAIGDRGGRLIRGAREFRNCFQLLSRIDIRGGVGAQADH